MSIRVLEERARQLGKAGEWGQLALGVNTRILEIDPDNLAALTRRARCNLACDDYPAAKADYERALALGPRSRVQQEDLLEGACGGRGGLGGGGEAPGEEGGGRGESDSSRGDREDRAEEARALGSWPPAA